MAQNDPICSPITGPVHCDVVDYKPSQAIDGLDSFSCGASATDQAAREVNNTARRLATGAAIPQSVILMRDESDALLGIACVCLTGDSRLDPVPYLNAYGRDVTYKERCLSDGTTTLGEALVRAAVEYTIGATSGGAPEMQAFCWPDNTRSHRPLEALDFVLVKSVPLLRPITFPNGEDEDVKGFAYLSNLPSGKEVEFPQQAWYRPASAGTPAPLPADVYTGP